jgi:hypothetical protein
VYESIRRGGNRDVFYRNVEYLLEEKQRRGSPVIIDVKVIDMDQNHHEIDQILRYWQQRGALTAVRRCSEWVGLGTEACVSGQPERIVCGHAVGIAAITWDGIMSGCAWDFDAKIARYNINEISIKEAWMKRNQTFLKLHFEHRWDELPVFCQNCEDWKNIGEERFDALGQPVQRNYEENSKMYQTNETVSD